VDLFLGAGVAVLAFPDSKGDLSEASLGGADA
jgi:hypothetical protein